MAKPIIIIGQQRSGTTALQSALSEADGVKNFGEIFQFHRPQIEDTPHNFYYYVNHVRGGWEAIASAEQAEVELSKYLSYLDELAPGSHYILDIKYNLWHHFSPGWFNTFGRPYMLEYFKKLKAPIIHVVRKNVFRQYVSNEFAARTQRWHYLNESTESPQIEPFDVDQEDLADYFEMVEGNEMIFRKRLKHYPYAVELTYEKLFDGRQLQDSAQAQLRRILPGWVLEKAESRYIKPGIDPVDWVNNAEALMEAFRETRFGVMVMDALRPPWVRKSDRMVADSGEQQAADAVEQQANHESREGSAEGTGENRPIGSSGLSEGKE